MSNQQLPPGLYVNFFPVSLPAEPVKFLQAARSDFQSLRDLRAWIGKQKLSARVYAVDDAVYGYGADAAKLARKGFADDSIVLPERPRLTVRLVTEGFVDKLQKAGGKPHFRFGRTEIHNPDHFTAIADGEVRAHPGYDIRSLFRWNAESEEVEFGLIIDVMWALRDREGQPLAYHELRRRHGNTATTALAQAQGEYLPSTTRINTEAARQRLNKYILPLVRKHDRFPLPCGGDAQLAPDPVRVVIGGDAE